MHGKQIQIPGATNKGQDEIIFMCSYCGSKQSSIAEKLGDVIECSACHQLPQVSIDVHKVLKVHNQKKHLKRINKRTTVWKIVFFLMLIATIGTGTLAVFAAAKAWRVRAIKIAEKKNRRKPRSQND